MVYPRQILYDVNHLGYFKHYFYSIFFKTSNKKREGLINNFKKEFKGFTGLDDLIPLSRARLSLYLFLREIITKEKNEVIMSPFTIYDLVNMVISAGGKPIFVDLESRKSPIILKQSIEENINIKTSCVIITHYHCINNQIESIAQLCKEKNIKLFEDCAISLGSRIKGKHVGSFSDAALFSFSLYKFISVYFGGALYVKDKKTREIIKSKLSNLPIINHKILLPNILNGYKMSFITSRYFFWFVFKIFRFGFTKNIYQIRRFAKNDPNPVLRNIIPKSYLTKVSNFQLNEFVRQLKKVNQFQEKRKKIYNIYSQIFAEFIEISCTQQNINSFINYPVVLSSINYKYKFISYLMENNFDIGEYFYRNCNEDKIFESFKSSCPNASHYSKCIVTLPTHNRITEQYAESLAYKALSFFKKNPRSIEHL